MNYVKVFNENLSDEYSEIIAKLNELLEFYNDLLEKVEDGAELPAEILSQIEKALTEKKATDMDCWDGYKKDGTKKNADGETVNNCVPVKEKRASNDLASMIRSKEALLKRIDQADSRISSYMRKLSEIFFDKRIDLDMEIKKLQQEHTGVLRDMEADPDIFNNPGDGSNPAVIAYGEELESIEKDIQALRDEKSNLSVENDEKLARMETSYNSLIDDLDSLKDQIKKAWK
jgi:hypothetical protein